MNARLMTNPLFWLVTYPKSGTTWVRSLWSALEQEGEVNINQLRSYNASDRSWVELLTGISTAYLQTFELRQFQTEAYHFFGHHLLKPTLIKSHDALLVGPKGECSILSPNICQSIIHVVRDPRDVAVSCQYYFNVSLDQAIDMLCNPECWLNVKQVYPILPIFLSDWSNHTRSVMTSPIPSLLIRYEDLLLQPDREVKRLAEFCQLNYDQSLISKAVENCSFHRLADQERKQGYRYNPSQKTSRFFRQGQMGGWKNVLSVAQENKILRQHQTVMELLNYL